MAQQAGDTEVDLHMSFDAGQAEVENQTRIAKRTKGDGNRNVANTVVHDLVPHQIAQRIGARRHSLGDNRHHGFARIKGCFRTDGQHDRIIDCRDTVLWRPARENLCRVDSEFAEVRLRPC